MDRQGAIGQLWEQALSEYETLVGWQYAVYAGEKLVLCSPRFTKELTEEGENEHALLSIRRTKVPVNDETELVLVTQLPLERSGDHALYLSLLLNRIEAVGAEQERLYSFQQERAEDSRRSKEAFLKRAVTSIDGMTEDLRKKYHIRDLDAARVCLFACRDMADQVKRLLGHLVPTIRERLITIDDHHVVYLSTEEDTTVFTADCRTMVEMIEAELMQQTILTISERYPFERLRIGYLEALSALRLGRLYYADRRIIGFRDVAVARLLELLPTQEAKQFSAEILPEAVWRQLHEEDISTIYMMFANNLNISETARKLYIHRNTMVYRLDRIHKIIGLDIRNFEEAILLRMVLSLQKMV